MVVEFGLFSTIVYNNHMKIIEYPKKHSEAEIQSVLWGKLRSLNIDARLQVRTYHSQLDLVVFKNRTAVCIVECKAWSRKYAIKQGWQRGNNSKQVTKYREFFGLPVFVCGYFKAIEPLVEIIIKVYDNA